MSQGKDPKKEIQGLDKERNPYKTLLHDASLQLEEKVQELSLLKRVGDILGHILDLEEFHRMFLDIILEETNAENCSFMLMDIETDRVILKTARGRDNNITFFDHPEDSGVAFSLGEGVAGIAALEGETILINDVSKDKRFAVRETRFPIASILCAPLIFQEKLLGVINLSHSQPGAFSQNNKRVMELLSAFSSTIIGNMIERIKVKDQEKFKVMFEGVRLSILLINLETNRIIDCNRYTEEWLGYNREELVQMKHAFEIVSQEFREEAVRVLNRTTESNGTEFHEMPFVRKDGSIKTGEVNGTTIRYQGRDVVQVTVRDITDRKNMELELKRHRDQLEEEVTERTAELSQTNRDLKQAMMEVEKRKEELEEANEKLKILDETKTNFLSTVSHELRTPLTSIKAFSEILLDNQGEDLETQMRFLNIVNEESERLTRMINDLLDIAKIESGRQVWRINYYGIRGLIEESATAVSSLSEKKHIIIEKKIPEGLPEIYGDHDKLVQVITNLLSNALKFTDDEGVIAVSAQVIEDQIRVSVKDNGVGIPEDQIDKVFEKFHQVDSSDTRKKKGTGLGLAICKEIVEQHKGKIWVESQLGKGSTFYFTVPCRKVDEAAPAEGKRMKNISERNKGVQKKELQKKILVVDDDPHIRELLRYELTTGGYEVIEAVDGEEAISLARSEKPDIITLDMLIPKVSGFGVLSILREDPETKHIPVMIISVMENKEEGLRLGAIDFHEKPLNRKVFLNGIRRITQSLDAQYRKAMLILDNDCLSAGAMKSMLSKEGFEVVEAYGTKDVVERVLSHQPDLIVFDQKIEGPDGCSVLNDLKNNEKTRQIPIVVFVDCGLGTGKKRTLALVADKSLTESLTNEKFIKKIKRMIVNLNDERKDTTHSGTNNK